MSEKKQNILTFWNYLLSPGAYWFWVIITLGIITSLVVLSISVNNVPFVYARYVLGFAFVLFLPGFTFIKTLFPKKELSIVERVGLSIGMSLALVPFISLLLNYTTWGITTNSFTITLLVFTMIFAIASIIREYQTKM